MITNKKCHLISSCFDVFLKHTLVFCTSSTISSNSLPSFQRGNSTVLYSERLHHYQNIRLCASKVDIDVLHYQHYQNLQQMFFYNAVTSIELWVGWEKSTDANSELNVL